MFMSAGIYEKKLRDGDRAKVESHQKRQGCRKGVDNSCPAPGLYIRSHLQARINP